MHGTAVTFDVKQPWLRHQAKKYAGKRTKPHFSLSCRSILPIGQGEDLMNAAERRRKLRQDRGASDAQGLGRGCEVVRKANLSKTVQDIVLYHHERYDGKGRIGQI
jgi:hypothetical protein